MIIRMMYILPMMLGRTYDVAKDTIGVDIFAPEDVAEPRVIEEAFYRSNYKTVETSSDVKEVLEINGDLSLKIKSGMLDLKGFGAYVKSTTKVQNSVDILVKVSFRTVSKSLPHTARPIADWSKGKTEQLGTHFVQSILYGGDLIACIRFKAVNTEDLQEIRAIVKASISSSSGVDLVAGQDLEMLDEKLSGKATMEISYFATVPLEGVPNTMEGLRDLVKQFENHVKKVNNGIGVPVEVELAELSTFDSKLDYIKNLELDTELEFFEEYFDDLKSAKIQLQSWLQEFPVALSKKEEKEISQFSGRLSTVLQAFYSTIGSLDLQKGSWQLDAAKEAYGEGKGPGMAGKFRRELNKLLRKVNSRLEIPAEFFSVYTHYGSSQCKQDKATSLIYSGYLASSPRNHIGAGHNYLCMPKEPHLEDSPGVLNESSLAGVKYGLLETAPFRVREGASVLKGVVCAVCLVQKQTVYTSFGTKDCDFGQGSWKLQYSGYLMAASDIDRSENVCVDTKLEAHQESYMGQHDQSLNFALMKHENGTANFVPCAVCSK